MPACSRRSRVATPWLAGPMVAQSLVRAGVVPASGFSTVVMSAGSLTSVAPWPAIGGVAAGGSVWEARGSRMQPARAHCAQARTRARARAAPCPLKWAPQGPQHHPGRARAQPGSLAQGHAVQEEGRPGRHSQRRSAPRARSALPSPARPLLPTMPRDMTGTGRYPPVPRYKPFTFYAAVRNADPEMVRGRARGWRASWGAEAEARGPRHGASTASRCAPHAHHPSRRGLQLAPRSDRCACPLPLQLAKIMAADPFFVSAAGLLRG